MMWDSTTNYWTKCWDFPLYSLGIPLIAAIPLPFFTFHRCGNNHSALLTESTLPLLYIIKRSCYFHDTFLRNDRYKNNAGQDQEFWTTDVVKWHFKEHCIQHNYTFFIKNI